jgi:nitroreductase
MADGLYLFEAARMALARRGDADVRTRGGDGAPAAPLELIYVASLARMEGVPDGDRQWHAALDAGFMAQNVSLFCAAEGLATCMRAVPEPAALAHAMALAADQRVLLRQQVGIPKDAPPRHPWM